MKLPTSLLTDRMPRRTRHVPPAPRVPSGNPYRHAAEPATAVSDALWLDDAERILHERRQPSFIPAPVRTTAPIPALRHPRPDAPAADLLARVRGAMRDRWRAESFVADKRSLPAFDAVTRIQGWQGLHMPSRPVVHQVWTVERWHAQAMGVIAAETDAAMAEVHAQIDAAITQCHQSRHAGGAR